MSYQARQRTFFFRDSALPRIFTGTAFWTLLSSTGHFIVFRYRQLPRLYLLNASRNAFFFSSAFFLNSEIIQGLAHHFEEYNHFFLNHSISAFFAYRLHCKLQRIYPLHHFRVTDVRIRAQKYSLLLLYMALLFQAKLQFDRRPLLGPSQKTSHQKNPRLDGVPSLFRIIDPSKGEKPLRSPVSRHR